MSYCVNCGVELDETVKKCPLCSTEVYNPNIKKESEKPLPYPKDTEIPEPVRKRFVAFIISMVMLIPNLVCLLTNLLIDRSTMWTWWVNSTSILVWVIFIFPFLLKRKRAWFIVLTDALAILGYAYVFNVLEKKSGWFQYCAVPLILIFALLIGFFIEWRRRIKPGWPTQCIVFFIELIIASVSTEMFLTLYLDGFVDLSVSLIISASCLAVIFFFITVATNKKLQSWIGRKFFVD